MSREKSFIKRVIIGAGNTSYEGWIATQEEELNQPEDLLLYLSTDVKAKNLPGIRGQIEDSMTVRMDAVYKWFMKQFK